jgi:hypothetical protein
MDFPPSSDGCKQELRPPPCPVCGGIGWWNGWVFVAQMVVGEAGTVERVPDQPRHRARCKAPECSCGSWTIYEAGGYPHRTFTLAVAVAAIAELAIAANATLTSVARHWQCDRRTVARWQGWVAGTAEPAALAQLCSSLDPDGLPAPKPEGMATPGLVLLLLECLARLLRSQGVPLEAGPGLGAILRHQFERFRAVSWLTRASPALRVVGGMAAV